MSDTKDALREVFNEDVADEICAELKALPAEEQKQAWLDIAILVNKNMGWFHE